ncbi:hypothetical protein BH24ACT1_BH24ACT1_08310 [soil metagenome]
MGMSSEYQSDDRLNRIERLGVLLRDVHRRLEHYRTLASPSVDDLQAWDADLYTYDDALISVADLLDVDITPAARDDLTPEQRGDIEDAVTAAGLDLATTSAPADS